MLSSIQSTGCINMVDVSVIVPFYNTERYIGRCLRSLVRQKGVDAEFILIDDGSTDGSLEICESFASEDERFKIIRSEHYGVSHARNRGLDAAVGKYVTFVDSDDKLLNGALKSLFEMAEETQCDCIKFNAKLVHGSRWMKDSFQKHDELIDTFTPEDIFKFKDCRPFVWMYFIRINSIGRTRFDELLMIGEDQEFIVRYLLDVECILFTSKQFYQHYRNKKSNLEQTLCSPDLKCEYNIELIEAITSYCILRTKEYSEWIFDTLYTSFNESNMGNTYKKKIIELFEITSIDSYLTDDTRLRLFDDFTSL